MKRQIFIKEGVHSDLAGKTVNEVAYSCNHSNYDENQVIITFTDNSYLAFGIERYLDGEDFILANNHFPPLECYANYPPHWIDKEGNIRFANYIQQQIDLGVVAPMTKERLEQLIKEHCDKQRERDYQQYLRLRKIFEKKEETK